MSNDARASIAVATIPIPGTTAVTEDAQMPCPDITFSYPDSLPSGVILTDESTASSPRSISSTADDPFSILQGALYPDSLSPSSPEFIRKLSLPYSRRNFNTIQGEPEEGCRDEASPLIDPYGYLTPDHPLGEALFEGSFPVNSVARTIAPGTGVTSDHYYPGILDSSLHPTAQAFLELSPRQILRRYTHLHPEVDPAWLASLIHYRPSHLLWAGTDILHVTDGAGDRGMLVVETNSCPSGQKSMPLSGALSGYRTVIRQAFLPRLSQAVNLPTGALAVIYDKNSMEASGYAHAIADEFQEHVLLVEYPSSSIDPPVRWSEDGVLFVRSGEPATWLAVRGCFRYVTQRPWDRIPINSRTVVLNGPIACLAGGRNKQVAAKAYETFNDHMKGTGLAIRTPSSILHTPLARISEVVRGMGCRAVIKVPYSNAGQGVYIITGEEDLQDFLHLAITIPPLYQDFIIQSLIGGHPSWSSTDPAGRSLYHVGTTPDIIHGHSYAMDLRMMVCASPEGYRPVCMYGRRARAPLPKHPPAGRAGPGAWEVLGTNLSVRVGDGWITEAERLIPVDAEGFQILGLGPSDLLDAYIQTLMATIAIDQECSRCFSPEGTFDREYFSRLNPDPVLLAEIMSSSQRK